MQVKVLFMMLMELCRRTAGLQHPLPISQVGSSNVQVRLHYIDGNYTVLPEVVEASLGPHMQVTSYGSTYFKFIIFVKQTKDWCSDISSALCYSLVDLLWCYIIRLENGLTTVFLPKDFFLQHNFISDSVIQQNLSNYFGSVNGWKLNFRFPVSCFCLVLFVLSSALAERE
jgi:hypothetical protein